MRSLKDEKKLIKSCNILQFIPFLDAEGLIRAKGRIGKSHLDFNAKHPILFHWKYHAVELFLGNEHKNNQYEDKEHVRNMSAEDVDPRHTKRLAINQEQVCYLQKGKSTGDNTSDGRPTLRLVRCFSSLYKCWSCLLWPIHSEG